ncbi:unnamed protein product [Symbiodinium pilosum]|uniref:Pseudouridine synthase RsuA/RluA-like domain-containing protein n=1 Tax=Symbiodinium pilosum TaxID=2952 RepID=A0A812U8L1_SYMPI|nr:unnamed protein product [Symbiodinium pilosum]
MAQVRVRIGLEALTAAVTACEGMSEWQWALQLFAAESQGGVDGLAADEILLNSVIAAAAEGRKWQLALSVLADFDRLGLQKTEVTYTAAISSCESEALWQLSVALFAEEIACGVLAASCPDGTQAGSVLSMIHRAEGRSKAAAFAERLRQVWLRKDATDPQPAGTADGLGLKVLARGHGVLVVDKPSGMLSEEVFECVSAQLRLPVSSTSRLDQPTSGILPVCLGSETAGATNWLRAQWAARLVSKSYLCLSAGSAMRVGFTAEVATALREVPGDLRLQEVSAAGRPARTIFTVLASFRDPDGQPGPDGKAPSLNLFQVRILTGRKHQIRVHLASIGQPLVGDKLYRPGCDVDWCPRMFLHCRRLGFMDLEGRRMLIKSPLPPELAVATYDQFKTIYGNLGIKGSSNVVASSFTAGLVYSVITMPFESAKNRMASQKPDPETGKLPYRGTMQTIQTVAGKEGAMALYNGFMPYCLRCGGHTVLMFFAVEELQKM